MLLNGKVHLSTLALVTVGMFDLVTTLMWLHGGMGEGNPLFSALAHYGSIPFVIGKLVFLAGPILLLEWVRSKRPHSAEIGTWAATALYLLLYVGHLLKMM